MRLSLSPFTFKVAFGAERTSTGRQNRLDRSKMTQCGRAPVLGIHPPVSEKP